MPVGNATGAKPADETISSDLTPTVKQALRKARAFAAEGRWRRLILSLPDFEAGGKHPHLIIERLRAALELADDAEIKICADVGLQFADEAQRVKLASVLINGNQPDHAWRLIESLPADADPSKVSKIARRIIGATKDAVLRQKAANFIRFNAVEVKSTPETVALRYPGDDENFIISASSLNIVRLPNVPEAIEDRVNSIWSEFDKRLGSKPFPIVRQYSNVFLNEIGQIWSPEGYFVKSGGLPLPKPNYINEVMNIDTAFTCVRESKGYYEWIVDRLATLSWRLGPDAPDCPILLRKEHRGLALSALTPMGIAPEKILAVNGTIFCRNLYVGASSTAALARRCAYQYSYGKLIEMARDQDRGDSPKRFYISRRDSPRRAMANETNFELAIEAHGFVPVVLSDLSLLDKINLFRNAEAVVGAHGAGLSHLVFAKPGLRIVEIMPVTMNQFSHMGARVCFSLLSKSLGLNHTMALHSMNPATSEWSADADQIVALV